MQDSTEDPQGPAAGLAGELTIGKRAQGRHQLRFKVVFKKDMKALDWHGCWWPYKKDGPYIAQAGIVLAGDGN